VIESYTEYTSNNVILLVIRLHNGCHYERVFTCLTVVIVGILAKKAVEAGLTVKPFIKTSLSPGSGVVTYYLKESGVLEFMEKLGYLKLQQTH